MSTLGEIVEASLNGGKDSEVSSRRLVTLVITLMDIFITAAIIALVFVVAMRPPSTSTTAIQAVDRLLEFIIIMNVTILLLIGIITWQNVNDTVSLIKGVPINNVAKAADEIQDKAQDIKDAVQQGATADKPAQSPTPSSTTA